MLTFELDAPQRLLLDTHIWIWASGNAGGPSRFGAWIGEKIDKAAREHRLHVCACSVWEIALKSERGELRIAGDLKEWVRGQIQHPGVRLLGLSADLLVDSTRLPPWIRRTDGRPHRDPNDRFLVTAARRRNAVLVTCDELILDYAAQGHLRACDARR
jgi:PIN domain nuclease of toxin-antitoxin system